MPYSPIESRNRPIRRGGRANPARFDPSTSVSSLRRSSSGEGTMTITAPPSDKMIYLGAARVDLDAERIFGPDGRAATLRPRSFAAPRFPIASEGRLVAKDALRSRVWPGLTVTGDSLMRCIGEIRERQRPGSGRRRSCPGRRRSGQAGGRARRGPVLLEPCQRVAIGRARCDPGRGGRGEGLRLFGRRFSASLKQRPREAPSEKDIPCP